jgi:hypothetical protein
MVRRHDEKGYVHGRLSNVRAIFGLVRTGIASSRLESLPGIPCHDLESRPASRTIS